MKSAPTIHRLRFTSAPLFLSLLSATGVLAATQEGCSDALDIPDTTGAGGASTSSSAVTSTTGGGGCGPLALCGFITPKSCQKCHTSLYQDWESSMHAYGLKSPLMIAQANQVFAADLIANEGLEQFCVVCHGPISSIFVQDGRLPFSSTKPATASEFLTEGIDCIVCHSYRGNPRDSRAVLNDFEQDFAVGKNYFGPIDNPAPNGGFHQGLTSPLYLSDTEKLCLNCHNTKNDLDGNKVFELGKDLFLQTTFDEWSDDYRVKGGGQFTCIDCHMAVRADLNQAADGFPGAPFRTVHDHSFVGVDYPLDLIAKGKDPQKQARRDLLAGINFTDGVAELALENVVYDGSKLDFDVKITNKNGGHNLPTGFTFMRQMWLEVIVKNNTLKELGASGELVDPGNDLCDSDTLSDSLGPLVQGCASSLADLQLVNFQTKLVDFVTLQGGVLVPAPAMGHETALQLQTGGVVARSRPADVSAGRGSFTLAPLKPFEARSFRYGFSFAPQSEQIKVSAKLLFRNLPPYFVRRLAQLDSTPGVPLNSLLSFDIATMQAVNVTVPAP